MNSIMHIKAFKKNAYNHYLLCVAFVLYALLIIQTESCAVEIGISDSISVEEISDTIVARENSTVPASSAKPSLDQNAINQRWPFTTKLRSENTVASRITSQLISLKPLYGLYLKTDPDLGGKILISLVISEFGAVVQRPTIKRNTLGSKEFVGQIIDSVMNWKFDTLPIGSGTDTLFVTLSFAKAGDLVRPVAVHAVIDGIENEQLRKAIKAQLPEVRKTYLQWVAFHAPIEGLAKLQVSLNPDGRAEDIRIIWDSGLPIEVLDTLQKYAHMIHWQYFYESERGILATSFIRFEDLRSRFLVTYGKVLNKMDATTPFYFNNQFPGSGFQPHIPSMPP
jgi:hypothetical protein